MVGRQLPFFSLVIPAYLVVLYAGWSRMIAILPAVLTAARALFRAGDLDGARAEELCVAGRAQRIAAVGAAQDARGHRRRTVERRAQHVGINRVADASKKTGYRLTGDVNFPAVAPLCSKITPGSSGLLQKQNPLANVFGRVDFQLPMNNRLVLRHNFAGADNTTFSRSQPTTERASGSAPCSSRSFTRSRSPVFAARISGVEPRVFVEPRTFAVMNQPSSLPATVQPCTRRWRQRQPAIWTSTAASISHAIRRAAESRSG